MSGLSLVVGVLTANMLSSLDEEIKPFLKGPNDLYVNNQKIGGILIYLLVETHGSCAATISVGLNINMKGMLLEGVDQPWSSLEHILNEQLDRNILAAQLIKCILKGMSMFTEQGLEPFLEEWQCYDFLKNKEVFLTTREETICGITKGITREGYLCLQLSSGEVKKFSSGDITLS